MKSSICKTYKNSLELPLNIFEDIALKSIAKSYCEAIVKRRGIDNHVPLGVDLFIHVCGEKGIYMKLIPKNNRLAVKTARKYLIPEQEILEDELPEYEIIPPKVLNPKEAREKHMKKERNKMLPSLRYEILQRDNFTCQTCGAKASEVKLHVDHIVPVGQGGTTEKNNLQVLCVNCNLGKGR